jgi:hypothetical protein
VYYAIQTCVQCEQARAAAEAAPVLAAAVALATAEAVPRQMMVRESLARLTASPHKERSRTGQANRRARAHLPESLSEHFGGEVVASPYLPPIVWPCYDVLS